MNTISFDDFKKFDLRAATIRFAERVEGSDKLLRLSIDLGEEQRQLVAGIGKAYEPGSLAGKQIVVVANLEPKTIMGLESQGILLAADSPEGPVLLAPDREVAAGTPIK